jgi:hypothetical protein
MIYIMLRVGVGNDLVQLSDTLEKAAVRLTPLVLWCAYGYTESPEPHSPICYVKHSVT